MSRGEGRGKTRDGGGEPSSYPGWSWQADTHSGIVKFTNF